MISAIRNKFGSKLLDSFIWLSIFIFVGAYFMPGQKSLKKSEEWAVSVNDEVITYQQYLQALNGAGRGASKLDAKTVLESFKTMLLIQSLTNKLNLQIAPEILNNELQKTLPGMIKEDGSIDLEGLKAKLIQAGFDQQ